MKAIDDVASLLADVVHAAPLGTLFALGLARPAGCFLAAATTWLSALALRHLWEEQWESVLPRRWPAGSRRLQLSLELEC